MSLASALPRGRAAGLLVPLFSMPSSRSWGIGEIGDIPIMASWLRRAGFGLLQLLPLNEMASWSHSPYSATSAMSIDPLYLSVPEVEDFVEAGGEGAMPYAWRADLEAVQNAPAIDYALVRRVKAAACKMAWAQFRAEHLARQTPRARAFDEWVGRESWWVEPYSLYRAVHMHFRERSWRQWSAALRDRKPGALEAARVLMEDDIRYRQYLQWQAAEQWARTRAAARPVALFGDLPFMVDGDSADVWARQHQFRFDASVGAPPDAFSEEGQKWGLPPCDWRRHGGGRIRVDPRTRAARRRVVRWLPHRPSRRLLPHLHRSCRREPSRFPSGRGVRAAGARRSVWCRSSRHLPPG